VGLVSALAIGAAVGAAAVRAPEPRVVYVDRPVPGPTVVQIASAEPPAPTVVPSAPPAPRPVASPAPSIDARGLAAERMLLDGARASLARGEPEAALVAIDRHAKAYPQGVLVEEREALAVKALAAAGRYPEARARGQRFREQFPRSVSLGAVNATLASLPE
jgi:hypothetical protein